MNESPLVTLLTAYFDQPNIDSCQLMTQGGENDVYVVGGDFGKVVVRIWGQHTYMGNRLESDINGELDLMELCNRGGVPTPFLYRSKHGNRYEYTSDGRWYAVISYVEGEGPISFTPDMASQIAVQMATMHNLVSNFSYPAKRSWPGTVIEMTAKKIDALLSPVSANQIALRQIVNQYLDALAQTDMSVLPNKAIHGDIWRENVKFEDGRLTGIFDFDDCRKSYFIEDIAKTLIIEFWDLDICMFGRNGENVKPFLQAYESVRSLTADEQRLLPLMFTARFLYQAVDRWDDPNLEIHLDNYIANRQFFI